MKTIREEIKDFINNGCYGHQLSYAGAIFGTLIEKREGMGKLVHFFLEDDEWYSYKFSVDAYRLDDLNNTIEATKTMLKEKNG
jgi:hypothetical protein